MQDPHVELLRYRLDTAQDVSYDNPPPVEYETNEFFAKLDNGILTCWPKEHYASIQEARSVIEQFLRAWEINAALERGKGEFHFIYESGEVIDRNPLFPQIELKATLSGSSSLSAKIHIIRARYPDPPKYFKATPNAETLWHRYEGYLDGHEPLLSMVYFCLSFIESLAGGRKNAAKKYKVDFAVLDKLGKLTSARGNEKTARKINKQRTLRPLLPEENKWIVAAVKALIRRVGEIGSNVSLPVITMSDLPVF